MNYTISTKRHVFSDPGFPNNSEMLNVDVRLSDRPQSDTVPLKSISKRLTELTATADGSLAAFMQFLDAEGSLLQLGDGISAVLYHTGQLRRQLARQFRMQTINTRFEARSAANSGEPDATSQVQQEAFRLRLNEMNHQLRALCPGDQARFDSLCVELRDLLQRLVDDRRSETFSSLRTAAINSAT